MTPFDSERWRAVSPLLEQALDMSDEALSPWLAALRLTEPGVAADVEALLAERHAVVREKFLESGAPPAPAPAGLAGQVLGSYTLLEPIGQGGMGTVWRARRSDGRFEGLAAVKLLNASLVGRAGEERFTREAGFLARLTHPNVAHLLDAGVSPLGQPYLILEHVEGLAIDSYADEQRLTIEARIRLFLEVLAAVAHAHANLIVHRDIKPSNVLVSRDGAVKLLDFGIATLLDPETHARNATLLTREGGSAMTPAYAAPEQLTGDPVTTATDVYSLGVLLYVLLGGRHPAGDGVRSAAGLVHAIVDLEPPPLSETVAGGRRAHDRPRGDLDVILARALKKQPLERYASVTAMAEDLRRYLAHQPISARPDTLVYRSRKFVRRHRVPVALAALAIAALAAGLAGTIIQARRAGQQRDFALRQLSRAEAINDLNAFLLSDAAPSGKPFTVGDLLARAERIVGRQQTDANEDRVELLIAIGRQYDVQDEGDRARRLLGAAHALARTTSDAPTRAKAACALASAISKTGDGGRGEALIREAEAALPDEPQFALHRIFCLMRASEVARSTGRPEAAVERIERAKQLLGASPVPSALLQLRVSMALAESYRSAGRTREAIAAFQDAAVRLAALGRDDTETAGTLLNNWALSVREEGQTLEAERLLRRAVAISSADGSDDAVSPMLLNNLGRVLADLRRLPEAADHADRAYARGSRAGDGLVVTYSLFLRASVYRQMGEVARTERLLSELEARLEAAFPPEDLTFASLASERSMLARVRGDLAAASLLADRAVAIAEATPTGASFLPVLLVRRCELYVDLRRPQDAAADAARALAMEQDIADPGVPSSRIGQAFLALGRARAAEGRQAEADAAFTSALDHLRPSLGSDHPDTMAASRLVSEAET